MACVDKQTSSDCTTLLQKTSNFPQSAGEPYSADNITWCQKVIRDRYNMLEVDYKDAFTPSTGC